MVGRRCFAPNCRLGADSTQLPIDPQNAVAVKKTRGRPKKQGNLAPKSSLVAKPEAKRGTKSKQVRDDDPSSITSTATKPAAKRGRKLKRSRPLRVSCPLFIGQLSLNEFPTALQIL